MKIDPAARKVKLFPMYVYVSESALAVPAMPIMASPTHAPISFLNISIATKRA